MKTLFVLLALSTAAFAQTPQELVNAAPANTVVLVRGGTWPPLVIDKPLTLVCWPPARFETRQGTFDRWCIYLDGPKTGGTVALYNVSTGGPIPYLSGQSDGGIAGGGFTDLELYGCTIEAPFQATPEGLGYGAHGISVSVRNLLAVDSALRASRNEDDICIGEKPGQAGIYAPGAHVTLVSSTSTGSAHLFPCLSPGGLECPDWLEAGHLGEPRTASWPLAGPGVVSATLELLDGAQAIGAPGARWVHRETLASPWSLCPGRSASGEPWILDDSFVPVGGVSPSSNPAD